MYWTRAVAFNLHDWGVIWKAHDYSLSADKILCKARYRDILGSNSSWIKLRTRYKPRFTFETSKRMFWWSVERVKYQTKLDLAISTYVFSWGKTNPSSFFRSNSYKTLPNTNIVDLHCWNIENAITMSSLKNETLGQNSPLWLSKMIFKTFNLIAKCFGKGHKTNLKLKKLAPG